MFLLLINISKLIIKIYISLQAIKIINCQTRISNRWSRYACYNLFAFFQIVPNFDLIILSQKLIFPKLMTALILKLDKYLERFLNILMCVLRYTGFNSNKKYQSFLRINQELSGTHLSHIEINRDVLWLMHFSHG